MAPRKPNTKQKKSVLCAPKQTDVKMQQSETGEERETLAHK